MSTAAVHPADPILQAYGVGKLDDVSSASVNQHLESCDSCRQRVAELSADDFLGRLQNAQVKWEKSAADRSPFGVSSTEGARGPVVPPPPDETLPPELVRHPDWEIIRELGRGGMGVVYLVKNKLMGRQEVLKVVDRHLVERPGVLDRFLREIQSAARLQHANIVAAYTAMRFGQRLALAMEYVDGTDLAAKVKDQGPLPVAHACYFIHQAALGLQHAHERGMVHRDIKPANLILARDGKKAIVKVLDFGLAKVTSEGQTDSNLTREGQMLGTPDYIAPEQIRDAQSADIRADIYSLGCTLYYLLTGGPPFRGKFLLDVYDAHRSTQAAPLNLVRPEVPVELAAVVAKMMAKEPRRRFQTPGEVAKALTPFFKPAVTQPAGPVPEASRVEMQVAPTEPSNARPAPTQPATLAAPSGSTGPRSSKTEGNEVAWDSLIEIKEDGLLLEPAKSTRVESKSARVDAAVRRPPPKWLFPVAAASLFGLVMLGIIIMMKNDQKGSTAARVQEGKPPLPPAPASEQPPERETASLKSINNSIGMTLNLIPAGEFLMGSPDSDPDAQPDEKPQHRVQITRPFYLGVHEVTQAQYDAVMNNNRSQFSANGGGKDRVAGKSTDRYPVENVSWLDAIQFCNKLSEKEGKKPFYEINGEDIRVPDWNGPGYRLPTEAEWEYACRANAVTRYSFGDDAVSLGKFGWYNGNSDGRTHVVGEKRPNGFGLFDMHGNVWEWCWDGYGEGYYKESPPDDPRGGGGASNRVDRGGGWDLYPRYVRSAIRGWGGPGYRNDRLGFRLALGQSVR